MVVAVQLGASGALCRARPQCQRLPRRGGLQVSALARSEPSESCSLAGSSGSSSSPARSLAGGAGAPIFGSGEAAGRAEQQPSWVCTATGGGEGGDAGGSGNTGGSGGGAGGGGSSWESSGDDGDGDELLNQQQAEELAAAKGISLPEDFVAAARSGGLRRSVLEGYASILGGGFLTSFLARSVPAFRDRLIADRMFFFKILAEVCIDSGCATVAELRKRGEDFWAEFEFYLSDLVVGLVLDVVLVGLIAPVAVIGRAPKAATATGLRKWLGQLPSAVFEKSGVRKYSVADRAACYVVKALEYSLAGLTCGFVGQGLANSMMHLRRQYGGESEHGVAIPPLFRTALVWGLFMGVSSNTRYQIVFGLERIVDQTIAKRIPQVAYGTTVAIRFINNVIGGENFIDMARWAGIQ